MLLSALLSLLVAGVKAVAELSSLAASSGVDEAACPASLRFMEPGKPEATIIPACRASHGHQEALYTSAHSQLTIGMYSYSRRLLLSRITVCSISCVVSLFLPLLW